MSWCGEVLQHIAKFKEHGSYPRHRPRSFAGASFFMGCITPEVPISTYRQLVHPAITPSHLLGSGTRFAPGHVYRWRIDVLDETGARARLSRWLAGNNQLRSELPLMRALRGRPIPACLARQSSIHTALQSDSSRPAGWTRDFRRISRAGSSQNAA